MSLKRVLILGATGKTGSSIVDGLLEYGNFKVEILVRPSSAAKAEVKKLEERGVTLHIGDIQGPTNDLVPLLRGIDTVISAIDSMSISSELSLVTAAKSAGVNRFVPCFWSTITPVGGVMALRDQKENTLNHIKKLSLPYTVIDVGIWYQAVFPTLPSRRIDYAAFLVPNTTIHSDGDAQNLLTDLRDIGRWTARIIADKRTLNKSICACGDVLSQNEIFALLEDMAGEALCRQYCSAQEIEEKVKQLKEDTRREPGNLLNWQLLQLAEYDYSRAVRKDNTPENARHLGYIWAHELFPDFRPVGFREFLSEVLDGKATPRQTYNVW